MFVKLLAYLGPAALEVADKDPDRAIRRPGHDLPAHRRSSARVDRVPESLECGLAGRADDITDFPPAMAGVPRTVDSRLQGQVRSGG